jgi:hypothetical protein
MVGIVLYTVYTTALHLALYSMYSTVRSECIIVHTTYSTVHTVEVIANRLF